MQRCVQIMTNETVHRLLLVKEWVSKGLSLRGLSLRAPFLLLLLFVPNDSKKHLM